MNAANEAVTQAATSGLTFFDWFILISLGAAAVWGAFRGFTESVLDLCASVAALIATLYLHGPLTKLVKPLFATGTKAEIAAYVGGFVLFLIICKLISHFAGQSIKKSPFGLLDRSLGALFGVFTVSLGIFFLYFALTYFLPEKFLPETVREARFRPLVAYGATVMAKTAPEVLTKFRKNEEEVSILDRMRGAAPQKEDAEPMNAQATGGYGEAARGALDSLVGNIGPDEAGEAATNEELPLDPEAAPEAPAEDRIGQYLEKLDNKKKDRSVESPNP